MVPHPVCRVCGETIYIGRGKHLFATETSTVIVHQIEVLTGVWLDDLPNMPQHICMPCQFDVDQAVAFRERCISTQVRLSNKQNYGPDMVTVLDVDFIKNGTDDNGYKDPELLNDYADDIDFCVIEGNPNTYAATKTESERRPDRICVGHGNNEVKRLPPAGNVRVKVKASSTPKSHYKKRDPKKRHVDRMCEQCGRRFADITNLKLHLLRHTGVKNYACLLCDQKYVANHLLQLHVRTVHLGARPYVCRNNNCSRRFTNNSSRIRHERTHTKIYPYQCKYCDKKCNSPSNLKDHERTHTGERPFICDVCNVAFQRKCQLNLHEQSLKHRKKYNAAAV